MINLGTGLHLGPPFQGGWPVNMFNSSYVAINAAGESIASVGYVFLSSGPGTSATFDSGGSVGCELLVGSVFANAGTTARVGVQDVAASGVEDGTFDVYADFVGSGGGITGGVNSLAMTTGSKTITHGDLIAVVFELTARAGTDTLSFGTASLACIPYGTRDTGGGVAKSTGPPVTVIRFGDGTIGYFREDFVPAAASNLSYNSSSTPDEYITMFQLAYDVEITALAGYVSDVDAAEDGELILYSDPLGTPVAQRTATWDGDYAAAATVLTSALAMLPITSYTVSANTLFGVAYRPTTAANRSLMQYTLGHADWRKATIDANMAGGSRTNQTGAFSSSTTVIPALGCVITGIDAGGAGGGAASYPFLG